MKSGIVDGADLHENGCENGPGRYLRNEADYARRAVYEVSGENHARRLSHGPRESRDDDSDGG